MMVSAQELEGFRRDRYFARAWTLTTKNKGWWKTALLLTLACLVPIVGPLGVSGYIAEWMRTVAWGNSISITDNKTSVGQSISSGWRMFVVGLVYCLAFGLLGIAALFIPVLNGILFPFFVIAGILLSYFVIVAQLRATIYQKLSAGFNVRAVVQMFKHGFPGLCRIYALSIVGEFIVGSLGSMFMGGTFIAYFSALLNEGFVFGGRMTLSAYYRMLNAALMATIPSFLVNAILIAAISVVLNLVISAAFALWMRQFNLPSWGKSSDPLPPYLYDPRDEAIAEEARQATAAEKEPVAQPVTPVQPASTQPAPAQSVPDQTAEPAAPATDVAAPAAPTTETDVEVVPFGQSGQVSEKPAKESAGEQGTNTDPFAPTQQ